MVREEFLHPLLEGSRGSVGVDTDGPEPGFLRDRIPDLLRNPEDFVLHESPAGESVGQNAQALSGKGAEGIAIESVAGSDKQAGSEPLCAQDSESGSNPLMLQRWIDARKFGLLMQSENGHAATHAKVAVAVHGDSCTRGLQRSNAIPEFRIMSLSNQIGVLIVWDDGENGRDAVARKN